MQIISHGPQVDQDNAHITRLVSQIDQRLRTTAQLVLPLEQSQSLLHQLAEFDLGRFLLQHRGLNGYWTSYVFHYGFGKKPENDLEDWLLNRSLLVRSRERFERFKALLAGHLTDGVRLASLPSGLMDDLLELDYLGVKDFALTGIDADPESLQLAAEQAQTRGLGHHSKFVQRDAWDLGMEAQFDVISSNGLNMYEPSEERLIALYQNFRRALRPGGHLVLSFLTAPPVGPDAPAPWETYDLAESDWQQERAIFGDLVQVNYLNFSTEEATRQQLRAAGFSIEGVSYSPQGTLPIVTARADR